MTSIKQLQDNTFIVSGRMLDPNTLQYIDHSEIKTLPVSIEEPGDFVCIIRKTDEQASLINKRPFDLGMFEIQGRTFIVFQNQDITETRKKTDGKTLIIIRDGQCILETDYFDKNAFLLFEIEETSENIFLKKPVHKCMQVA